MTKLKSYFLLLFALIYTKAYSQAEKDAQWRERILLQDGWRFFKYEDSPDTLIYDVRPEVSEHIILHPIVRKKPVLHIVTATRLLLL